MFCDQLVEHIDFLLIQMSNELLILVLYNVNFI